MAIKFSMQLPNGEAYRLAFLRLAETVADMGEYLQDVMRLLEDRSRQSFYGEGPPGLAKWKELSPITRMFREQDGIPAAAPILSGHGILEAALTERGGGAALRQFSEKGLLYGTRGVEYASFHQTGTRQKGVTERQQGYLGARGWHVKLGHVISMPPRPLVAYGESGKLTGGFRKDLVDVGRKQLVRGVRAGGDVFPQDWNRILDRDFDQLIEFRDPD